MAFGDRKLTSFHTKPRKPLARTAIKTSSKGSRVDSKASKPNKRSKLPTVKTTRNKCDKLLTPIIKAQHPECFLKASANCNFYTQVAHHHIKKSQSSALRYDLENLIPLCNACHMMLHANESVWVHELIERKGIDWARSLKEKNVMVKTDVHFYIENLERLTAIHNKLKWQEENRF